MRSRHSARHGTCVPADASPLSSSGHGNYRPGAGSNTITVMGESVGWRAALLGTVAAGVLWLGTARYAKAGPALCNTVGDTATCEGDQSDGISSAADFNPVVVDTLAVLTDDIEPGIANVDGISFVRVGVGDTITIDSNTVNGPGGPFSIIVTGPNGDGIRATTNGTITIDHVGNIDASAGRYGIFSETGANAAGLSIDTTGTITADVTGIHARDARRVLFRPVRRRGHRQRRQGPPHLAVLSRDQTTEVGNPLPIGHWGEGFTPRSCASLALRKSHGGKGEGEQAYQF